MRRAVYIAAQKSNVGARCALRQGSPSDRAVEYDITFLMPYIFALIIMGASFSPVSADYIYIDQVYGTTRTRDVVYGVGNTQNGSMNLLMDVWQPRDKGTGAVLDNRPAIVIQDGGSWTNGSKDNSRVTDFARYMAQRGYTVFAVDYRQFGDQPIAGSGPWDQNLDFQFPLNVYPTANVIKSGIEDFATAISYVRANSSLYGIDPDRIAAAGGSAGAINAMYLQYNLRTAHDQSFQAQAVVALVGTMYGNYDLVRGPQSETPPLFLLNGVTDQLIPYSPDLPNLHNEFETRGGGLYYEQWLQDLPDAELKHGVDYTYHPWSVDDPLKLDTSKDVLERVADFLAYKLAGGPIEVVVPEASTILLTSVGAMAVVLVGKRRKRSAS